MVASKMQQRLGSLLVGDIVNANNVSRELLKLKPSILFKKPHDIQSAIITTLLDASHSGANELYGQSGTLSGFKLEFAHGKICHPNLWS